MCYLFKHGFSRNGYFAFSIFKIKNLYLTLFFLVGLVSSFIIKAQTLAQGDISIIGVNSNAPDGFAFVNWVSLPAGTIIKFTDNGFNSSSSSNTTGNFREGEQYVVWTNNTGSAIAAGTIITIQANAIVSPTAMVTNLGTITSVTNSSNGTAAITMSLINNAGDQIFAFQGTGGPSANSSTATFSGTLLFGLCYSGSGVGSTTWISTGAISGNTSYLPGDLSGSSQIFLGPNFLGGQYTGPKSGEASLAAYKALVVNPSNWNKVGSGTVTFPSSTDVSFTTTAAPAITTQPSNGSICAAANTTFSITASNATTYQWYVSTDGGNNFNAVSDGAPYTGAASATLTITNAPSTLNAYQYKCVATGSTSPAATSNAATLTVTNIGTWLGTSNTLWSNTANWSCGTIPVAATNVTVSSSAPNMPVVDITNAVCNNLTINSGATVSITNTLNNLDIKGALTNNGTFTNNAGKTTFSGDAQSIPAGTYSNLEINGTSNKTLAGAVTVTGTLTLTAGCLEAGGYELTIGSAGSIVSSSSNFIVISGNGTLKQQNIGATGRTSSVLFPVGLSSSVYTPVSILNTGTADVFGVRLLPGVNSSYDSGDAATGSNETANNVKRAWLLTEGTPGGSNTTLTFQWNASDELSGFDRLNCFVGHYYDNYWHAGPTGSSSGAGPYTRSIANVTSFSPFGVGSTGSVLPLNLLSFTGKVDAMRNMLSWTTTNEINVASFSIERGIDGIHFTNIGSVDALANGATGQHQYQFTDVNPANQSFYRLKMTDKDGTYKYSNILNMVNTDDPANTYTIFPNPVTGSTVYIKPHGSVTDRVMASVIDATGKTWYTSKIEASVLNSRKATINIHLLPAGIYILQIRNEKTGAVSLLKFKK